MTKMTKMTEIKEGVCLLAVEASGNSASMAVVTGDAVLGVAKREATHAHAPHMADLLRQCLAEAEVEAGAITHVAAGCGPGSFTGIRTGLALAKGVALALAVPIYGVSSLTALLSEISEVPSESTSMSILVVVDSRRGGYFACLYDGGHKAVTPVFETNAETLAGRVKEISPQTVTLLGHDAANLARALQSEGITITKTIATDPNALAVAYYVRHLIQNGVAAADYPAIAHYHRGASLGGKASGKQQAN